MRASRVKEHRRELKGTSRLTLNILLSFAQFERELAVSAPTAHLPGAGDRGSDPPGQQRKGLRLARCREMGRWRGTSSACAGALASLADAARSVSRGSRYSRSMASGAIRSLRVRDSVRLRYGCLQQRPCRHRNRAATRPRSMRSCEHIAGGGGSRAAAAKSITDLAEQEGRPPPPAAHLTGTGHRGSDPARAAAQRG